jgi:hypothetical protein
MRPHHVIEPRSRRKEFGAFGPRHGLNLSDRIALSLEAPRVALDAYGWTREFWVGVAR